MADVWANSIIPEPCATLQGERIPSAILKIVFRRILFFVLLMRAAAFVSSSSSVHLLKARGPNGCLHWSVILYV